jgi:polar amino acid transport system substrate-binding protein
MRNPFKTRTVALAATILLSAGALTSCGGSSDDSGGQTAAGAKAPMYHALPAQYQKSKKIIVGSDIAYAPMEYYDTDGTTVLGLDKDLTDALSKQLGVVFEWHNATFDGLITQLQSKRIDVAVSGMSDTPERQKKVDFVDYYKAGPILLVQKGNPRGLRSIADLCGTTVAVQRGTTQEEYAQEQSKKCTQQGKKPINLLSFDRETEAMLQVKSGRAAADLQDYPVAAYNARTSGGGNDFEVVGQQIQAGPLGIAVNKDNTQLRDALQKAMQKIIDDGTYAKLLEKYDVPLGAVDKATVNGG